MFVLRVLKKAGTVVLCSFCFVSILQYIITIPSCICGEYIIHLMKAPSTICCQVD